MLTSLGRILEQSTAANTAPELHAARAHDVAEIASPVKRSISQVVLAFAVRKPDRADRMLDTIARTRRHRYLGSGVEFTVYLREEDATAVKVHRASALLEPHEQVVLVKEKIDDHEQLSRFLGCSVLSQQVVVAEHLLGGGYRTVQIEQPYIEFGPEDSPFQINNPSVSPARVEAIARKFPGAEDALDEFAERSRDMFEKVEEIPDTNGTNNVVMTPVGIALIDSTPIKPKDAPVQHLILAQLDSLQTAIREIT